MKIRVVVPRSMAVIAPVLWAPVLWAPVLCALVLGCKDSSETGYGKSTASELKETGKAVGQTLEDAGSKVAEELAEAGAALKEMGQDAAAAMDQKGDQLAVNLKQTLPELEKVLDTVKVRLNAAGGELKGMVAGLDEKFAVLKQKIDALAASGAAATAELKQDTLDAFAALRADIEVALAKLKS